MEVILLERVEKLGAIGDVVKVKDGFARNYLLPNKKALRANEANRKLFEANRARIEEDNADRRTDAEKASKGVDGKTVKLIRQASNTGQLYGSVSARDIAEALEGVGAQGHQEPGRARPPDQGDRGARGEDRASSGGRGDGQGQRRPLAGRSRSAGAGYRRSADDVRAGGGARRGRGARADRWRGTPRRASSPRNLSPRQRRRRRRRTGLSFSAKPSRMRPLVD